MQHIGLFEGIGGFSIAGRWAGWETIAWCEWDEKCQRVLKHHFPNADAHGDITTTDFTRYAGQVDILTGGFPCQPYSSAGKRLGKEDDRHLWPEMLRAIREVQPRWVVGENVRGLTNWNGGLVFDEVQADLENEGYEVTPYLLPACAVNAPHRRDRIWFVAHNTCKLDGWKGRKTEASNCGWGSIQYEQKGGEVWHRYSPIGESRPTPNPNEKRLERETAYGNMAREERFVQRGPGRQWENFPTQSPVCGRNDGFPGGLVGITFPKWREFAIGALGNAIVPQVAFEIFKAINEYEKNY